MNRVTSSHNARRITVMGMLIALILILTYTPLGFIQLGPIAATLIHLPVLIGLLSEGLAIGLGLGFAFGAVSMLRAYTTPTITSFIFMNPVVALLPRLLIPLVAWGVYLLVMKWMKGHSQGRRVAWAAGAFAGALVNTVGVLMMIFFLYAADYAAAIGISVSAVGTTLFGVAMSNGLPEAVLAAIVVPAVLTVLSKITRHGR